MGQKSRGLNQGVGRATFPLEALGDSPFPYLFLHLGATCLSWLWPLPPSSQPTPAVPLQTPKNLGHMGEFPTGQGPQRSVETTDSPRPTQTKASPPCLACWEAGKLLLEQLKARGTSEACPAVCLGGLCHTSGVLSFSFYFIFNQF